VPFSSTSGVRERREDVAVEATETLSLPIFSVEALGRGILSNRHPNPLIISPWLGDASSRGGVEDWDVFLLLDDGLTSPEFMSSSMERWEGRRTTFPWLPLPSLERVRMVSDLATVLSSISFFMRVL
jgi:hypothetical protein